jgi:hypothetical protein
MSTIAGGQASGYSFTPGIIIKPATSNLQHVTIGLKVDELFNSQQWGTGAVETVPPKLRLGIAYHSPNPGLFAIDISQTIRSEYAPKASIGYEWAADGLSLRTGYDDGFTAGAGFESGVARIDYAYVQQMALSKDNVHRISLSGKW